MKESTKKQKEKIKTKQKEVLIVVITAFIISITLVGITIALRKEAASTSKELSKLEDQIKDEEARTEELKEEQLFMQTKDFIEKIARERLGLVMPNETVIKSEN